MGGAGEEVRGGRHILRPEAQRRRLSVGAAGFVYKSTEADDTRAPPPFFELGRAHKWQRPHRRRSLGSSEWEAA